MRAKSLFLLLSVLLAVGLPAFATGDTIEQPLSLKVDAGKLYVGYDHGKIRVFDSSTLELLNTFNAGAGYVFSIETDANNIYYGTDKVNMTVSRTVAITKAGEPIAAVNGTDFVLGMAIDGGKIYTCERTGVINVRSIPNLKLLGVINNTGLCRSVRVDGRYIYAPTGFGNIGVWDKASLRQIKNISVASDFVRSLWDDSNNLYSVSDDSTFSIWNKTDFSMILRKEIKDPWEMTGDSRYLYATSARNIIVMNKTGAEVATLQTPGQGVSVFDLYVSGNLLYAAHQDGTVRIWNTDTFQNTVTSEVFTVKSNKFSFLPSVTDIFYVLLVIGVAGFIGTSLYDRRKKKVAAIQSISPPTEQAPAKPAEQP